MSPSAADSSARIVVIKEISINYIVGKSLVGRAGPILHYDSRAIRTAAIARDIMDFVAYDPQIGLPNPWVACDSTARVSSREIKFKVLNGSITSTSIPSVTRPPSCDDRTP